MIVDLHIHSKYSRATSKNLNFENLAKYGKIKGIDVLGTGDFTHPKQFEEIEKLEENNGILKYKNMNFLLQTEISLIYSQNSKIRKIHVVLLSPSKYKTREINEFLSKKGNLKADGRPIFGKYTLPELVEDMKSIDNAIEIIPAHIWTPWFGLFGSKSGFNSLKEAFDDQSKHIHAIETGLSSDPLMNWRIKELDDKAIISNSDSHSFWPWRIGREATDFNIKELSYDSIVKAIKHKKINSTIEVDPKYGKYYFDGHRNCNFSCNPKESIKMNNICPICNKPLTLGVLHRVEELATRSEKDALKKDIENKKKYFTLLPLAEIISFVFGKGLETKFVKQKYEKLTKNDSELNILLNKPIEEIARIEKNDKFLRIIRLNREGKLKIKEGFDGEYGKIVEKEQSLLDFV